METMPKICYDNLELLIMGVVCPFMRSQLRLCCLERQHFDGGNGSLGSVEGVNTMRMKTLILSLCLVLVVLTAAAGTIAYLTDTDEVVNSFTVGNIGMKVDETSVNPDGTPVEGATDRVKENSYHLIPGKIYTKDPTMTITAGSEACYVRMIVTITEAEAIKAAMPNFLPQDWVADTWDATLWKCHEMKEENNAFICEFRYFEPVDASTEIEDKVLEPLFSKIKVPETLTNEDLKALQNMQIKVVGHAIQAATFADEVEAWAAFTEQTGE